MLNTLREEDTVARLGGDEFTIIMQNIEYTNLQGVLQKILHSIERVFYIKDIELHTSFSIGISEFPQDGTTAESLLKHADAAMYQAKAEGKNRYYFYNKAIGEKAHDRSILENDIYRALEQGEFVPYFQAKVDAKSEKIVGFEALIRWNHPTKGLVFPDAFIPFSEEVGLVSKIDEYMMQATLKQAKIWLEKGLDFGVLSLNASVVDLGDMAFVSRVEQMLKQFSCDPARLEIEILERQTMKHQEKVLKVLHALRDLGVSLSIDDFGTGYSSLSYLKNLPVNTLKIDRSFVMDLPNDKDAIAIVKAIITLAENLSLSTIAEGVEDKSQAEFLAKAGCNKIQGYYYSKPIKAEDFEQMLLEN